MKIEMDESLRFTEETARRLQEQSKTDVPGLEGFIYDLYNGLYVAKETSLQEIDWAECHDGLAGQGSRMGTLSEFRKFLLYARSHYPSIYASITAARNPWRGEHLDACFEQRKGGLYMLTHNKTKAKKLDKNTLMEDRQISIGGWLNDPTGQGLPKKSVQEGSLCYSPPIDGRVARFYAGSAGASLYCDGDPDYSSSWLGVRAVREVKK